MEEEIEDYTVSEVISKFKSTIHHELAILNDPDNNWVNKATLYEREQFYDLESLIVTDKVNLAKELFTALGGKSSAEAPIGHKWMGQLMEAFNIHSARSEEYLKNENEISSKIDPNNIEDFKELLKFRNTVSTKLVSLKKSIKGVITGEKELPEIGVRPHAKTPVAGLALAHVLEEKHPEIKPYIQKRKELTKKGKNEKH